MLKLVGRTPEGWAVVQGVYAFYETEGLPLDVILDGLKEHRTIPDWPAFVLEAVEAGMKPERALAMLDAAIVDSFGTEMRNKVLFRLRQMIQSHEPPPQATVVLRVLASEYDTIYEQVSRLVLPDQYADIRRIVANVLGEAVAQRMDGEVVGIEVVEKLPDERFEKL